MDSEKADGETREGELEENKVVSFYKGFCSSLKL